MGLENHVSPGGDFTSGFSDLIGSLYEAAVEPGLWSGMAGRIAAAFDSSSAVLKLNGSGGNVQLLDTTANLVVSETETAWADHWHRNDLWVERSVAFGLSRVITSQDLISPEEERRSAFYQEWLRRLDIHHMAGVVFPAGDGSIGVLGIHRPKQCGHFSVVDCRRVAVLLPHLRRALLLGRRIAETTLAEAHALDALDSLDTGVISVDAGCRIHHANARAEALLSEGQEIYALNGRLVVRHQALNLRLGSLVRDAVAVAGCSSAQPEAALGIPREGRAPLTLAVAPLRPRWSRLDGQPPLALVFLRDPESATVSPEQLRSLFGLTRSEAVVAAELARGRSLAQIAAAQGVSPETVRSHLKRLLAKTGTRRQAEAVALITRSVAGLARRP